MSRAVVAGASGLIGRALVAALRQAGWQVTRLVRREVRGADEVCWNPASGAIDPAAVEGVDAVVNLAGANVGDGRWTRARRAAIRASRIESTRTLVQAMARAGRRPAVFVSAAATGIYGSRGDEVLTEVSTAGAGFLAEVCRDWEAEAVAAEKAGVRTVCARFGVVLAAEGGALAKLLPVFRLGLGGRIGDGRQWMSWIGRDDAVGALRLAIERPECRGPMNLVAPGAVTNAEFTRTLARVVRRPAFCAVPAAVLRLALGTMAEETILASARVEPVRLREAGFVFRTPGLEDALRAALRE